MEHKSHILEEAKDSSLGFFIKRIKVAFLIAVGLSVWGAGSAYIIPKESAPQIDYGIITVSTIYQGASSVDMDQLVTQEIENKLKNISEITKISSVSKESLSQITLELDPSADNDKVLNTVRNKIDEAKLKLPEDAENPSIHEINSSNERSLFTVHLTGNYHPVLLLDYAEKLKTYLEQFPYIQSVNISGGAERSLFIDLDPVKLEHYKISPLEVIDAVKKTHSDFPIGEYEIDKFNYSLRFSGKHKNAKDISNVIVSHVISQNTYSDVKIEDIAKVYESNEKMEHLEYFTSKSNKDRKSSVSLQVNKSSNTNIFAIDPIIRENVIKYIPEQLSDNLETHFSMEEIEDVRESYENVFRSGMTSIVIVILIIMLFLGAREAIIAGIVIPLTFLTTIGTINFMGGSLNFMVNFSMILALGILVDTAIVIVEGMHEGLEKGYNTKEAALIALYEFKFPLLSGMLTTLAVFIPLFTLPGVLGKYLSYIPISVAITLTASLFISLFLIPAIGSCFLRKKNTNNENDTTGKKTFSKIKQQVFSAYHTFIQFKLSSRLFRMGSIYLVILLFVLSLFIPVKFQMFPGDDFNYIFIEVTMPKGNIVEETNKANKTVENFLWENIPEMKHINSSINKDKALITITLLDKKERKKLEMRTSIQISEDLRYKLKDFTNYSVNIKEFTQGPPIESPIAFRIIIDDPQYLSQGLGLVEEFKEILKTIPGTDNITDDLSNTPGEITYTINIEEALRKNLDLNQIKQVVKTAVSGTDIITLTRGGREVDVTVRYNKSQLKTYEDIKNIQIKNKNDELISLSQVINQELKPSLNEIRRQDRRIALGIFSQLTKEGNALEIAQKFNLKIKNYQFPAGIQIIDAGENA